MDTVNAFAESLKSFENEKLERMTKKFAYIADRLVESTMDDTIDDLIQLTTAQEGVISRGEVEGHVRDA